MITQTYKFVFLCVFLIYRYFVTALDPAQPHFSATNPVVRLDTTDALFVDAIHTDARPFMIGGMICG